MRVKSLKSLTNLKIGAWEKDGLKHPWIVGAAAPDPDPWQ